MCIGGCGTMGQGDRLADMPVLRLVLPVLLPALLLAGCGLIGRPASVLPGVEAVDGPETRPPRRPGTRDPVPAAALPGAAGATAAALDTTTAAEKAVALAAPAAGGRPLGTVAVSLGSPAEPGFWFRGAIVTVAGPGRVTTTDGQSIAVDLRPGTGAAQLSLPAFRALGLSLTDLPQVEVRAE